MIITRSEQAGENYEHTGLDRADHRSSWHHCPSGRNIHFWAGLASLWNWRLLEPGETFTFTASRIATAGQYINVATAAGAPPPDDGLPVSATGTDNHFGSIPAINVVKLTNGTDNNTGPGAFVPVGSTVTFTYVVTNTGNVPLSGVAVLDNNGSPANAADDFNASFAGGDTNANGLLDLSETWTFAASRIATPGQYTNIGTATGTPPPGSGAPVTDSDPDNHFGSIPAINVVKLTNGTDNNAAPGPFLPIGSTVTFNYVVTNPGNVPLSGVTGRRQQRHTRQPGR